MKLFLEHFIAHSGIFVAYAIIFLVIFAESGILLGFFLPGDSLLISLGLLSASGHFNIWVILILGCLGAVLGDSVGYSFGYRVGPSLFTKPDSRLFKQENLRKAHSFYEKYGKGTIVLARFVPFARTFAPILAGLGKMNYREFLAYNIAGGVGWVCSITLIGYFLGRTIPDIENYILLIVLAIVLLSAIPAYFEYRKHQK